MAFGGRCNGHKRESRASYPARLRPMGYAVVFEEIMSAVRHAEAGEARRRKGTVDRETSRKSHGGSANVGEAEASQPKVEGEVLCRARGL